MRMWAKGAARVTLLTAGFVALGAGPAFADVTSGDESLLGGNQINAPVSVPIDLSGNAIAVLGHSVAGSSGGASVTNGGTGGGAQTTSGDHGILVGNQINAPISVPVNACGNALAVFGRSAAGCEGGASVTNGGSGGGRQTSGHHSIGGGNQINAPISAPINVCGNSAAVLGDAVAGCKGGASVRNGGGNGYGGNGYGGNGYGGNGYGGNGYGGNQRTSGDHGVGGGNQVNAPISVPVNVCGNAAAVLGEAAAGCGGLLSSVGNGNGGGSGNGYGTGRQTRGDHSILGGTQVNAPIKVPVNVCGNAVGVLGQAYGSCGADTCFSSARIAQRQAMSGLPQLPITSNAIRGGAVPVNPGALPALPQLPVRLPHDAPAILPHDAPAILPGDAARPGDLGVPGTRLGSGRRLGDLASTLPGTLPGLPVRPLTGSGDGLPIRLPGLRSVPVGRPIPAALSAVPQHGRLGAPEISEPEVGGPEVGGPEVGGPPKEYLPMRATAAEPTSAVEGGSLLALTLGGLLAASSAVVSMTRRLRRGH